MTALRRAARVALGLAYLHLVFGAIVRISGSGMGCGDNWPRCDGYWFPPLSRPDLIVEVTHRYLASLLTLSIAWLVLAAWRRRGTPGASGEGGVLRMAGAALGLVVCVAMLGAVTVKLGNTTWATVAHWTLAMTLLAVLASAAVRAGAIGGAAARVQHASAKTARAAIAAGGVAFATVAMGGITAKYPGASFACPTFPLCGNTADAVGAAVQVQLTHRVLAGLLLLHLFGMILAGRKRGDAAVVRRALHVAFAFVLSQFLVAGALIGLRLPPALRSLHEALGVGIWLSVFTLAYLARIAARPTPLDRDEPGQLGAALPPGGPRSGASARELAAAGGSG